MAGVTQRKSGFARQASEINKLPDLAIEKELTSKYHRWLWLFIALQNIVLDFGRPFLALLFTDSYFPLNRASLGDYAHMLHNVTMSFSILYLLKRRTPDWLKHMLVIVYVMGASIHLVGDSINHRLVLSGYKNYLTVEDNPIMRNVQPRSLIQSFQLLYFYDEYLGHFMWYLPLFISLYLYYCNSFAAQKCMFSAGPMFLMNLALNAGVFWYLVTEAQLIELYIGLMTSFLFITLLEVSRGRFPDINGIFIVLTMTVSGILILIWVYWLWNDTILRERYPGVLYVPEPWSVLPMRVNISEIFG
ncbi:Ceroid-lipofuscinosis neuronal protein 6 [Oopsacas minuta]|uniref:Ceroid-lipofuscinosis neuronal protein 6 n=1 Tax=Oopsacas minuta TaxID=111878 RepID=A0AAV7K278_9METZ|nr:Ceroid-lipofuscinosis neuronal protein 6 [Oopsacas minuta]